MRYKRLFISIIIVISIILNALPINSLIDLTHKSYASEFASYIDESLSFVSDNGSNGDAKPFSGSIRYAILPQSKIIYIDSLNIKGSTSGGTYRFIYVSISFRFTLKDNSTTSVFKVLFDEDVTRAEHSLTFENFTLDYINKPWANEVKKVEVKITGQYRDYSLLSASVKEHIFSDDDNIYIPHEVYTIDHVVDNRNGAWKWWLNYAEYNNDHGTPRGDIRLKGTLWYFPNYGLILKRSVSVDSEIRVSYASSLDRMRLNVDLTLEFFRNNNKLSTVSCEVLNYYPLYPSDTKERRFYYDGKDQLIRLNLTDIPNSFNVFYSLRIYKPSGSGYFSSTVYLRNRDSSQNHKEIEVGQFRLNTPPKITSLSTPINNYSISNEPYTELSKLEVRGFVRDDDNDDILVTAEIAGVSRSVTIKNTSIAKEFKINFDAYIDEIREGRHTLTVVASDGKLEDRIKRTVIVKRRIKNGAFVLLNEPVYYETIYNDVENDPKYGEEYKFIHDPNYFENSMGLFEGSGVWTSLPYNSFNKTGLYEGVYRVEDNPKSNPAFAEFRRLSRESFSSIEFKVHRIPIANFTVNVTRSGSNYNISINDLSYDLDHMTKSNKGISQRQWQWKELESNTWTNGKPPSVLPYGKDYIVRLRVRDIDGIDGKGVWSDWYEVEFNTRNQRAIPIALFTLQPQTVSHKANISVSDRSFSPSGHSLSRWKWIIKDINGKTLNTIERTNSSPPTSSQLKNYGLGEYELSLEVYDGYYWSEPYSVPYEVINYPPEAKFNSPDVVYRDSSISLQNLTPTKDKDGENVSFKWQIKKPGSNTFEDLGTTQNMTFKIQDLINNNKITPQKAISNEWEIKLIATDTLGAKSEYMRSLEVINHIPTTGILGNNSVEQYTTHTYTSQGNDMDTGDKNSLIFRWKHIKPNGSFELYTTKDITVTFNEVGTHSIEHYVIDQIGDKSNTATLKVDVEENKAPEMVITSPNGTLDKPTVISNDPLMQWNYSDPENDPQEKYSFDFYYADDDILERTITNNDPTGNIREYQVPNGTFERFRKIRAVGRTFSKHKWSELSNEVFFIINDAPIPGFILDKHTIVRGEEINVISTAYDPNEIKGDFLTHKYYIKKLPDGSENLYTDLKDFTFTINTLTANRSSDQYQIRQVVTDSLGVSSEHTEIFTVVNQKPNVEILEPSSSNKNNPYSYSDLKPTIRWSYSDLDGDSQKKYIVNIFEGDTNNLVVSSGEISSSSSSWTLPIELVEDKLYSVRVEVYDGHEWNTSSTKYFKVFTLRLFASLLPNPAMAGDELIFTVDTEGYAEKIEIIVPNDIINKDNRGSQGYIPVSYPLTFNVDGTLDKKTNIFKYVLWHTTDVTLSKENAQLRPPYKFIVRAYKGTNTKEVELYLDVKGNVLELIKPGVKLKGN